MERSLEERSKYPDRINLDKVINPVLPILITHPIQILTGQDIMQVNHIILSPPLSQKIPFCTRKEGHFWGVLLPFALFFPFPPPLS